MKAPNSSGLSSAGLKKLLQIVEEESQNPHRFEGYERDPEGFAKNVLGVTLWKKQVDCLLAVRDHHQTAVRSGHSTGKTFVAAVLVLWWLYAMKGMVVTTAPTKEHVEDVLWVEIGKLFRNALVPLPGVCTTTDIKVGDKWPDWTATGITTNKPEAFRGRHHPRLLVMIDEANGVEEAIHVEVSTLATGEENRVAMIANPTGTSGTFYDAFSREDSGWFPIHISCLEHPNVVSGKELIPGAITRRKVESWRKQWGESHPFWFSRVLGEFPRISNRGVIPLAYVERARRPDKWKEAKTQAEAARIPMVAGLDVARYGENRCVMILRRGDAVVDISAWQHESLMSTAGRAMLAIQEHKIKTLVVDSSGVGAGVVDRLLELNAPVIAYNGGHRAFTPGSYTNRRTELWWHIRHRLEHQRLWLPPEPRDDVDRLCADLVVPEYEVASTGRIKVETKEALLDRGVKSPDWADALVMCFAMDADPEEFLRAKPDPSIQDPQETSFEPAEPSAPFEQLPWGF